MPDAAFMERALELARRGAGAVEPNPMVGAVVVRGSRVVGEGWHKEFGGPHAEVFAIRAAGAKAKGATLYVNLEPCSPHPKKTPPCTDLVAKAGIAGVVAAMRDPNPAVCGRGLALLRKAGIRTKVGLLEKEARRLNAAFEKFHRTGLPYVLSKWAMTLDGKIATPTGDSRWISGEASRAWLKRLRDEYQAILIGANTALRDDPGLRGRTRLPVRIVLDSKARVPLDAQVVRTARAQRTILAVSAEAPAEKVRLLERAGVEVIRIEEMDMRVLFEELANAGLIKILVEGGGEVHASVFEDDLADEVCVFVGPKIAGGKDAKTPVEGDGVAKMAECLRLRDVTIERIDDDVVIRGRVHP
ncbi:MAG: bifunctional diaminohydroxyphosphoribosylaminopyrimidine deaminase/5-amino-6-(5-phosphoribosylamino)uracil reductase RibD [Planctomycetes bacterium]|nr:bifunctional diaminohydroxyphosphoribosylaminopyrimidine deaminase/5-amino-6-(5-phosphoribosylamino)uracil reductase RibD [Planctomycetota bacterium]